MRVESTKVENDLGGVAHAECGILFLICFPTGTLIGPELNIYSMGEGGQLDELSKFKEL